MVGREFLMQSDAYGLSTVEIQDGRLDYADLQQLFAWQDCDVSPRVPVQLGVRGQCEREIEVAPYPVQLANRLRVEPTERRAVACAVTTQ